jgi:hypothetical protein
MTATERGEISAASPSVAFSMVSPLPVMRPRMVFGELPRGVNAGL